MNTDEPEWSPSEIQRLKAWRDCTLPPSLEDTTVRKVEASGLIGSRLTKKIQFHWTLALAASVLFFALGFVIGNHRNTTTDPYSHILLLYEDDQFQNNPAQFEEYGRWATTLRDQGIHLSGERLSDLYESIGKPLNIKSNGRLTGYFLVSVKSTKEAFRIAQTCPHLSYGGQIEIRGFSNN